MKLPAYGKALLAARRAGDHPPVVALIYGHDWRADVGQVPRLALNPDEYQPGAFSFAMCAGLLVEVYDQVNGAFDHNVKVAPPTFGKFFDLLRELAQAQAGFRVRWPPECNWGVADDLSLAWSHRWIDSTGARPRWQWPAWWSAELHEQARRRLQLWCADLGSQPPPISADNRCAETAR